MYQCVKCGKEREERATCQLKGCKYSIFNAPDLEIEELYALANLPNAELKKIKVEQDNIKRGNMKRLLGALKRTLSGQNKTGELIHGFLDLVPIPNQIVASLFKGDVASAKNEFREWLTLRNVTALIGSIAYFAGWITLDDLKSFIEFIVQLPA
jgi:hypothetical protein